MVAHWSLCNSKYPQVSWTLYNILSDLNIAVILIVSISPFISKSSSFFTNLLGIVLMASSTIGITVTFRFNYFFRSLARSEYSSLFSLYFIFILWSAGTGKCPIRQVLFFLFWLSVRLFILPRLDNLFVSQNPREVCASHSPGWVPGCAYTTCSYGEI